MFRIILIKINRIICDVEKIRALWSLVKDKQGNDGKFIIWGLRGKVWYKDKVWDFTRSLCMIEFGRTPWRKES